jgi:phospholipase C
VNVILVAVGEPLIPKGGPSGAGPGATNGGGTGGQTHFIPFSVAVRAEIFKPGTTTPAATASQTLEIYEYEVRNRIVLAAQAEAVDAELGADWSVMVTNAPPDLHTAHPGVPAQCDLTVRYQLQPGNLGKVDHIVVLMMENRSFDHILGYLSLPPALGGKGRTDVNGLTGNEYNYDPQGVKVKIQHRTKPNDNETSTAFLTDPGHEWPDVAQQLQGDAELAATIPAIATALGGAPGQPSNGGFVVNFAEKIANDEAQANLPPVYGSVKRTAQVADSGRDVTTFTPAQPGRVTASVTISNAPTHSESGDLGRIDLHKPGSTAVIKTDTSPVGPNQNSLGLTYQATAGDLAIPGDWTVVFSNLTGVVLECETQVTYVLEPRDTSGFEDRGAVMSYYTGDDLWVYALLAEQFAICDRWYSSLPTDTWPNRLYALSGGSGGMTTTPPDPDVINSLPAYTETTIFEVLQQNGVEWNIFFSDLPFALVFSRLAQDAAYTSRMRTIDDLERLCEIGELPSFCWVEPNFQDVPDDPNAASDDHPPGDIARGQNLIGRIYNMLTSSPAWAKTLFVVTYDEHGGFYDHVRPPAATTILPPTPGPAKPAVAPSPAPTRAAHPAAGVAHAKGEAVGAQHSAVESVAHGGVDGLFGGPPDDDPRLRAYGLRVPTFLVSPWVGKAAVSKEVYDHTSLLSTIMHRFCVQPDGSLPNMGKRTQAAITLESALDSDTPMLSALPQAQQRAAQGVGSPVVDENTFGNVLRATLFGF